MASFRKKGPAPTLGAAGIDPLKIARGLWQTTRRPEDQSPGASPAEPLLDNRGKTGNPIATGESTATAAPAPAQQNAD